MVSTGILMCLYSILDVGNAAPCEGGINKPIREVIDIGFCEPHPQPVIAIVRQPLINLGIGTRS